jgi:predicted GTPase
MVKPSGKMAGVAVTEVRVVAVGMTMGDATVAAAAATTMRTTELRILIYIRTKRIRGLVN